ncbi:hypothetical protein RM572_22355 [Streptomyces sp. DSM 42041]|uniref:Uncharacterized protein n=1 Tax=Streptomyces hazeniae TaxID=3075538 RepID=A0ABU2NWZ1_9ACTN|nr:hypothetical protein [Streptomyces sp. DSM 42041]MDT0381506.1 hypothetical protein [Streptomyces sp. DSM 42041]
MTPPRAGRDTPGRGHGRPPLTPAQRRAVTAADPATGEIRASAAVTARLTALGLARRHGTRGAHYLTPAGRTLRDGLLRTTTDPDHHHPGAPSSAFTPATGDGPPHAGARHPEAATRAWHSLLEIRRLTGTPGTPADWERARPVHAVALTLEAAGLPPTALDDTGRCTSSGYRVTARHADPGTVRVAWHTADDDPDRRQGHDGLGDCAHVLSTHGWDADRYTDIRRRPYLLVTPGPRR